MNWKAFITGCVSAAIVSFPQNIIGCGPGVDPYDYYTSFFHQNLPEAEHYKPFYYTGYSFLYDSNEPVSQTELLAEEWAAYCGNTVKKADAQKLVNKFAGKDLANMYSHIEKKQPLKIPDSVRQNSMSAYFLQSRDLEALGYILFAKQVEPFVTDTYNEWTTIDRDSIKMSRLIKNGQQLYDAAKKDFFKQKYAYQVLRLAHYSGRYADVVNWYDAYAPVFKTNSLMQQLSLSLKAGALFRSGREQEAAYEFSRAFAASPVKRVSNYLGFTWAVDSKVDKQAYVAMGKNNAEKATLLALLTMGSTHNNLDDLQEIFKLNPASEALELLVVREINKLEEKYFTPTLQGEKGGKSFYFYWTDANADSIITDAGKETKKLASFLNEAAKSNKVKQPGLLQTAAAYASYMIKDYSAARKYLEAAEKLNLTQKVKDQWALTNLLISINEQEKIDSKFEEQLLPSLQWLEGRVKAEKAVTRDYWEVQQWRSIYRNLMSEILARRYHQQGDLAKETLAMGAADWIMKGKEDNYTPANGIEFLRNNLLSADVEKLYGLITATQPNGFEQYLFTHNTVTKKAVVDFAGTSYLREYNWDKAIAWFKRSTDKSIIKKNPFIDLLYDREEQLPAEKNFRTTKLAFAQEMMKLEELVKNSKVAANLYYKMALGLYNITYYGHTWELVQYYRSGVDGYAIPAQANSFQKEYYGAFTAQAYFEKAMQASTDKNFKARCLFMMAKCAQKQVHQPQYSEYETNWDQYDVAFKTYWPLFKKNKYFPEFVKEYSTTAFYKQAFNSCSYLRDFVRKK